MTDKNLSNVTECQPQKIYGQYEATTLKVSV